MSNICDLLGEIPTEIQCTCNNRQLGKAINLLQLSVVGNLIGAVDRGELRDRDIGQLGIINKDKTTSSRKIRCGKGSE